jgi:hypothetical protein
MKTLIDIPDDKRKKMDEIKNHSGMSLRCQILMALGNFLEDSGFTKTAKSNGKTKKQI